MNKTWRCTVCGYLHEGDSPPDSCPVCYADSSKFELVTDSDSGSAEAISAAVAGDQRSLLQEMRETFAPHPVAAHFPNALIPTAALFVLLYLLLGQASIETAAYYLLLVIALAVPPTAGSGIYTWQTKFKGQSAPIFRRKIILSCSLLVLGSVAALWRWQNPEVLSAGGFSAGLFVLLLLGMLGCVSLLGHYGGMLVFSGQQMRK